MIRRELAKDPKLANESWDRFLPKFRKQHLKTSEKTARKREAEAQKAEARKAAGLDPEEEKQKDKTKKVYTPFPPAQQPRKVSIHEETVYGTLVHVPLLRRSICNSSPASISSNHGSGMRRKQNGKSRRCVTTE